jgi:hypothetical protein
MAAFFHLASSPLFCQFSLYGATILWSFFVVDRHLKQLCDMDTLHGAVLEDLERTLARQTDDQDATEPADGPGNYQPRVVDLF